MRKAVATQPFGHEEAKRRNDDVNVSLHVPHDRERHEPAIGYWHTVVCIASGPSLTADDCNAVRIWREAQAGRGIIVVNTSFRLAPWADILYAMDRDWWNEYGKEARAAFTGELWSPYKDLPGVNHAGSESQPNSGAGAIALAAFLGAKRIILLGYDGQKTDGRAHWHPDHPNGLDNGSIATKWWPEQFAKLKHELRGVRVVNATRKTALTCFDRDELHVALADIRRPALYIEGMHGLGDNLHQRSIVKSLIADHEVWLDTPWPCLYHDLAGLRLVGRGSTLRTQAKNAEREAARFTTKAVPPDARHLRIFYRPDAVQRHGSVLAAMAAHCGVEPGDFRLPIPTAWRERAEELIRQWRPDRPIMIFRPLNERSEWGGCRNRNPDHLAYRQLFDAIRERYFVISVADFEADKEWPVGPDLAADVKLHRGELDIEVLAALTAQASLVFTAPGFAIILAQAVGTPSVAVFGGYERSSSFSAGARYAPYLGLDPIHPCECFSHTHACDKRMDMTRATARLLEFVDANYPQPAIRAAHAA